MKGLLLSMMLFLYISENRQNLDWILKNIEGQIRDVKTEVQEFNKVTERVARLEVIVFIILVPVGLTTIGLIIKYFFDLVVKPRRDNHIDKEQYRAWMRHKDD